VAKLDHITGQYVYINVQNVEYRVYFEESGRGIPLLCQHTAGADSQQWRHVLNDKDITSKYRVIAFDLPFHGRSLPPDSVEWWKEEYKLTKSFFVDFLVEFSHALNLHKPVFIGGCMGGCIGLYLALEQPDEFGAIIGLETVLCGGEAPPDYWNHPRIGNNYKSAVMWSLMAPGCPEKTKRETLWVFGQSGPPVLKGDFFYYFNDHDLTDEASQIDTSRIPVYLLTGEYDPVATPADTQKLAAQINGVKFIEMKGLGHLSLCEDPSTLKKYLIPVLNEIADKLMS
jgi:pimeloyl-ACP methyl ester carboxylesterase